MPDRGENSIEVEGLERKFKNGPLAVAGIDLRVEPGQIYGFLGPNGAGKSTTVHMLTTLLPPTAGRARVAGLDVVDEGPAVRAAIGAALQEAALDPHLTAREHMRLQTALHGLAHAPSGSSGETTLIERVGLADAADRRVERLLGRDEAPPRSRPRARARAPGPLPRRADHRARPAEPRRALGRGRRASPATTGVTVFLTTQYLEEADHLAERVGIIDDGKIVAEGTPAPLKAEIGRPSVEVDAAPARRRPARSQAVLERFGEAVPLPATAPSRCASTRASTQLTDIVRALDGDSLRVANLELHAPTLDDVFLAKTGRHLEGAGDERRDGRARAGRGKRRERRRRLGTRRHAAADPGRARSPAARWCAPCASRR